MLDESELREHVDRLLERRRRHINDRDYDQWRVLTQAALMALQAIADLPGKPQPPPPETVNLRIEPGESALVLRALGEGRLAALSHTAYGLAVEE